MLQYRYATGLDKFIIFLGVICSAVCGLCMSLVSITYGAVANAFVVYGNVVNKTSTQQEKEKASQNLMYGVKLFVYQNCALGIISFAFTYLATVFLSYSAINQIHRIRLLYLKSILDQDISWHDVNQTGDFASRMSTDIKKLEEGIGEKVCSLIFFLTLFISSLIMALVKGWELALVGLIVSPITSALMMILTWITSKLTRKETNAYGEASAVAEEVLVAIRTVIAFDGQQKEKERYDRFLRTAERSNIKRSIYKASLEASNWLFIYGSLGLIFWYGVKLIIRDKNSQTAFGYDVEILLTILQNIISATTGFGMASPYVEIVSIARGAAKKIFLVIQSAPVINASKGFGKQLDKVEESISFQNVYFNYPSRPDIKVLQGFNLEIKAGETVALVGGSGCGKSTCIQLVQRFYDPISGAVFLDGTNLKEFDLSSLRSHFGVVNQEPILFNGSIADNIRFGWKGLTQKDIEEAATKANAHSFITELPQGYDTMVSERGVQLSGGQKQRIAIARALVRKPGILLLDEATSALDINSEALVQAALDSASSECTTIIVAHRLSTIRNASRILVFADGKITEEGTHDKLMEAKGIYYQLVTSQIQATGSHLKAIPESEATSTAQVPISVTTILSTAPTLKPTEDETKPKKQTALALRFLMKLNFPETCHILFGCMAAVATGATVPVYAVLFGGIFQVLTLDDEVHLQAETDQHAIYFAALAVITAFATFLQLHLFGVAGEKLSRRLRGRMFESMLKQEIGWFDCEENGVGSLCAHLSAEAASVQGATGSRIGIILNCFVTMALCLAVSFYFDWRLSLITLCFAYGFIITFSLDQKVQMKESQGNYSALKKSSKIAVEAISNIRTVASLSCENTFYEMYKAELAPYYNFAKKHAHLRGLIYAIARNIAFFAYAACIYFGAKFIISGNLEISAVFIVTEGLLVGSWSIVNVSSYVPNLRNGLISANRIYQLLQRVPKVQNTPESYVNEWVKGNIKYEKIHFSYPTRPGVRVLKGLDLSVLQGKMVALVGPSGSGKSTVVQLLERFYDPTSGTIEVDGQDIKTMKLEHLRSHLGIVSQEPNLFSKTIAENIAYGDNSRRVSMDEVISAAQKANIHNFVVSLPQGYDTKLGEKGTQLSGGQKQRIAIARALVRNPKVLLLDEATSALDAESEKVVQKALDNAKQGRTCISIAHRLSTIQDADVICTLSQGVIAEMGTHKELLNKKGLYYNLYNLQGGSSK